MRHWLLFVGLLCGSLSTGTNAGEFVGEMKHALDRAFIPKGFDNDDAVQIVVTGKFVKPCLQLGPVFTQVIQSRWAIEVELTAYEYDGKCIEAGTPFRQTVYLGMLRKSGTYTILDRASKESLGTLRIDEAKEDGPGTDSHPYVPLDDAFILNKSGKSLLILRGVFASTCDTLENVEFRPQADVLVALPMLGKITGRDCQEGVWPFEKAIPISVPLPQRPFLLHVRAVGGQAFSKLVR